jgi:hypothetical protein
MLIKAPETISSGRRPTRSATLPAKAITGKEATIPPERAIPKDPGESSRKWLKSASSTAKEPQTRPSTPSAPQVSQKRLRLRTRFSPPPPTLAVSHRTPPVSCVTLSDAIRPLGPRFSIGSSILVLCSGVLGLQESDYVPSEAPVGEGAPVHAVLVEDEAGAEFPGFQTDPASHPVHREGVRQEASSHSSPRRCKPVRLAFVMPKPGNTTSGGPAPNDRYGRPLSCPPINL